MKALYLPALAVTTIVFLHGTETLAQSAAAENRDSAALQEPLRAPYQSLFGRGPQKPDHGHTLDVTLTLAEAYDDDLYGDQAVNVDPGRLQVPGFSTMFLGSAEYQWRGRRVQVGVTGASAFRYYPQLDSIENLSDTAGVGVSAQFARRSSVFFNQSMSYSPSYLYGLFPAMGPVNPGDAPAPAPDYTTYDSESYTYGTTASVSYGITRRGQLTASAEYSYTDYVHEDFFRRDLASLGAQADFAKTMNRNTTVAVGYRFRATEYDSTLGRPADEHGVVLKFDSVKPLSRTRQAAFGFSVTPSAIVTGGPLGLATTSGRQFRTMGDARFSYQFNRVWKAQGSYSRSLAYVPGLREPVFADGFTVAADGALNLRWNISGAAGYTDGQSLEVRTNPFTTYTGNVRLRYALNSKLAVYSEYLYYYYNFRGSGQLPPGVPPSLERNGIRIGLTTWIPMRSK